jgi:capsular exopolysaccharide synthesis family protein
MSWFYEALMRAEGNPAQPGQAAVAGEEKDGDSFLGEIEGLAGVLTSKPRAEACPGPAGAAEHLPQRPREAVASNGFRHVRAVFREESRLVFHSDPRGMAAEQFRLLRRSLVQAFPRGGVLMVTSPGPGDGKTLTAMNLCASLADAGESTLLVELDLRRPSAQKVFGCKIGGPGVETVLRGDEKPEQAPCYIEELGFHAALVAEVPSEPSRLLGSNTLADLLSWARNRFRWVVLDTAPVLPNADVAELLPAVDAVLLVARVQVTPRELLRRACEVLGKRLHGVVLNEATISSTPYYRYLSDYYHPGAAKPS